MSESPSTTVRHEGNRIYKSVCIEGLSPETQLERLQEARNLYSRAHNSDGNQDEKCSAAKNVAQCEWRIGKIHISRKEKEDVVVHHFKEAFRHYQYAFLHGDECKDSQWISDLKSKYSDCLDDLESFFSDFSLAIRIRYLSQIASLMSDSVPGIAANVFLRLTKHNFHEGINAWQKGDYLKCKNQMAECHFPMHEARRYGHGQCNILQDIHVLENDVHMHMCIAESSKSRQIGDELLERATHYYETVDMNMVWEIIDWYKQAILLARELDMEQEAIAMQRIGRVYAKVLKFKPQAKEYYKRAIQLAVSMAPRIFTACDWYIECSEMLKKYQEETIVHEQEQQDKEREKIKEEIKVELDDIKLNHEKKTNIDFLLYAYKTYPPKNTSLQMEKDAEDNMKKALQKAILHYHPDKSEPEKNGMKWKILTEEITKYLTKRYECIKFSTN